MEQHHKREVFVLLADVKYEEGFSAAGGTVKRCSAEELRSLAVYFNVFHRKDDVDTRMLFLTERDGNGYVIEELLDRGEFSLEEYVTVSLYQLDR